MSRVFPAGAAMRACVLSCRVVPAFPANTAAHCSSRTCPPATRAPLLTPPPAWPRAAAAIWGRTAEVEAATAPRSPVQRRLRLPRASAPDSVLQAPVSLASVRLGVIVVDHGSRQAQSNLQVVRAVPILAAQCSPSPGSLCEPVVRPGLSANGSAASRGSSLRYSSRAAYMT